VAFVDRTLTCVECGQEFTFTADDQEFHSRKGYQEPKRCPTCRAARRTGNGGGRGGGGGGYSSRPMYDAVCDNAGALPAAAGQACLLQRLLRQGEAGPRPRRRRGRPLVDGADHRKRAGLPPRRGACSIAGCFR
jgi:hypothetical protein